MAHRKRLLSVAFERRTRPRDGSGLRRPKAMQGGPLQLQWLLRPVWAMGWFRGCAPFVIVRFSDCIMKPVKHFASATGFMVAVICLIAMTGAGRTQDVRVPPTEAFKRPVARFGRQGLTVGQQTIQRPMASDRTLSGLENAVWVVPSSHAAVPSTGAFRQVPRNSFTLAIATFQDEPTRSANFRRQEAALVTGCIAILVTGLGMLLARHVRLARLRNAMMVADRATLAATNEQLAAALASASAKAGQLEATLAGMGDGVSMVDAHLCLVEWNAQFPIIAGVPAEILRVGLPMEDILHAQVRTGQFGRIVDPRDEVDRRMARLRVAPFGVVQRQRPDGHTIELRRNRLPDGGFVTLYTDVTEQKRAEEALRRAQAEAEAANAAKSRFVAIVSHEIRTPLNTLLNTVRLLGDSGLAPAQRSLLAVARQSGEALDGLISDILDLSQIEAGKLSIRPSLFELRPLLEGCVDMFAAQAAEKRISFHIDIADGVPTILLSDPARLRQVLLNLVSNAVKYAHPGEIRLIVEADASQDNAIKLLVKDPGPMIGAEARGRLFRPFSRLDRADGADMVGTGLGLSICSQLMVLLGGSIGCDPWSGDIGRGGNVFWITLPFSALPLHAARPGLQTDPCLAALAPGVPAEPTWRRPLPRTRILLVEDVLANQLITAILLRRQGHLVDIACDGEAAIKAVRRTPYDLVLMDIFMPGMGGQEATRIMRTLPAPAGLTPIIALTANTSGQDEAAFKASGMDGLLGKPMTLAGLLTVLRKHVWAGCSAGAALSRRAPLLDGPDRSGPLLSSHRIKELRTNLSPETFADLVEECLLDLHQRLPALHRAVAEGVSGAIIAHSHTMVGVAAGYGMSLLERRLRNILEAAREGNILSIQASATSELERVLTDSAQTLRDIINHMHA